MTDAKLETAINGCTTVIDTLPVVQREKLATLVDETRRRHKDIEQAVQRARDALDDWRLLQKYILFDWEARRREVESEQPPQ